MFNRLITPLMMILAISLSAGFVSAQEAGTTKPTEGDNPQYLAWKDFAIGSSATIDSTITNGKNTIKIVTTMTLVENTAKLVAVSIAANIEMNGQKTTSPPQRYEIQAKIADQEMTQVGTEEVTVPAGTFETTIYDMKAPNGSSGKIWSSSKVPGGAVRVELKNAQGEVKGELTSYEVK